MKVVMRSSPAGVRLTGDTVSLQIGQKWSEQAEGQQQKQYANGANVEGTLKSAFPDGDKQGVEQLRRRAPSPLACSCSRRRSFWQTRSPAPATARTWASTAA